jgi:membrane protease YdiL (CAAX protease family)
MSENEKLAGLERKSRRQVLEFLRVPWGVRDVIVLIAAWFGIQAVLVLLLTFLARLIPQIHTFLTQAQSNDAAASFILYLVEVLIGLGLVAAYMRRYHVGWQAVGWRKVSILKLLKYLLGLMILFIVLANLALLLVKLLVPGFNANQPQTNDFTGDTQTHRSLALAALVLLPPIFEETIFRGFIFPALAKRTGLIWGAVLSSALFGVAHGQPNLFVYTSILGLLLCFMYVRTKSIIPGIFLHMLNNYLAFLAISSK